MNLLFLDFDGVLHPASAYATSPFMHAQALAECLRPHECQIVISSSWRFQYSLNELLDMLPQTLAARVTGITGPAHIGALARYREIENYLNLHTRQKARLSWRALDDSNWEFPPRLPELILCNPNEGVTSTQLRDLTTWLAPSRPK